MSHLRVTLTGSALERVKFCVASRQVELEDRLRMSLSTTGGIEFYASENAEEYRDLCTLAPRLYGYGGRGRSR